MKTREFSGEWDSPHHKLSGDDQAASYCCYSSPKEPWVTLFFRVITGIFVFLFQIGNPSLHIIFHLQFLLLYDTLYQFWNWDLKQFGQRVWDFIINSPNIFGRQANHFYEKSCLAHPIFNVQTFKCPNPFGVIRASLTVQYSRCVGEGVCGSRAILTS